MKELPFKRSLCQIEMQCSDTPGDLDPVNIPAMAAGGYWQINFFPPNKAMEFEWCRSWHFLPLYCLKLEGEI